jgi:U3 small nucleolar RNA-associated protein 15
MHHPPTYRTIATCHLPHPITAQVQLYSSVTNRLKRSISRFKDVAYSASFRHDGSLLVAGSETKEIQVFDMSSRAILRTFRGHDRAVRRTQFSPDGLNVLSGSDDGTVKLWDLSAEAEILTLEGHTDYVRATDVCESASHIHLSGSYDHTARLWDTRAGREVLSVDHGAPIESVLMFPGGSSFITAGGNYIKVCVCVCVYARFERNTRNACARTHAALHTTTDSRTHRLAGLRQCT